MANLYTPYDNGTFEASPLQFPFKLNDGNNSGTNVCGAYTIDNELPIEGSKSGKVTISNDVALSTLFPGRGIKAAVSQYNFYFRAVPATGFFNIVSLSPGRYRFSLKAITPSANPVADDDALVGVGDINALMSVSTGGTYNGVWTDLGGGKFKFRSNAGVAALFGNNEYIFYKVSTLKDTVQTLTYDWDEQALTRDVNQPRLIILLNKPLNTTIPIVGTKNLFVGGKLFFDEAVLGPPPPTCTLAFSSPAYNKTDETGVGLNNGTIQVHATGNGGLQYSLDGGTFQSSNSFTGVAIGTHTVTVKDTTSCDPITTAVTILQFNAPPPPPPPVGGTLLIDEKPVNPYNFLSWFNAVGVIGFTDIDCTNQYWDLPEAYRIINFPKRHYACIAQQENLSFYINFEQAVNDPAFSEFKIALIDSSGAINLSVGNLQQDQLTNNTKYNIYATINLLEQLPGKYYLAIYNSTTNAVLWVSSGIEVMTLEDAKAYTVRIRHRNNYDIYNYYYTHIPDYLNEIRLRMNRVDEQSEGTLQQYRGASNGKLRNVSFELDKWIQLEAYFFDDNAIRGMYVFQMCDSIDINGKNYLVKDIFKTSWDLKRNTNKGLISLYEQQFSTANRFGKNLTVIGSDDSLIIGNGGFIKI